MRRERNAQNVLTRVRRETGIDPQVCTSTGVGDAPGLVSVNLESERAFTWRWADLHLNR